MIKVKKLKDNDEFVKFQVDNKISIISVTPVLSSITELKNREKYEYGVYLVYRDVIDIVKDKIAKLEQPIKEEKKNIALSKDELRDYLLKVIETGERSLKAFRLGQHYFNVLYNKYDNVGELIRNTEYDPYYNDSKIPNMLNAIQSNEILNKLRNEKQK